MQLICGDCLEVLKTLPDESVDAVITDPPYGILKHQIETAVDLPTLFKECQRVLKPNSLILYFGQQPALTAWNSEAFKHFKYKQEIIWYKRQQSSMIGDMLRVYENIMVCVKGKKKFNKIRRPYTDVKESLAEFTEVSTVIRIVGLLKQALATKENYEIVLRYLENPKNKDFYTQKCTDNHQKACIPTELKQPPIWLQGIRRVVQGTMPRNLVSFTPHNKQRHDISRNGGGDHNVKHPTVKPIQLMEYLLDLTTSAGDVILDPFMGSGTTGIAAKNLRREFIGIEIYPEYFKIAQQRIEAWQLPTQHEMFD